MAKNEKGERVWNSTLRRRKKLENKSALKRSQFNRSSTPKDKSFYAHAAKSTGLQKKSRLKSISKKHKRELTKKYFPAHKEFFKLAENRHCWICLARSMKITRSEVREIMLMPEHEGDRLIQLAEGHATPAVEVHHWAGRIGRLLDFVPYFIPECRGCREWPHMQARAARALDLVAPASLYNVFPREREEEIWEDYKKFSSFESKRA